MKKIGKNIILVLVLLQLLNPFAAVAFQAKEKPTTRDINCFDYTFSVDRTTIYATKQVKFTLDYQSVTPVCSEEQLAAEKITIDFSELVDSGSAINASYDTKIFNVNISDDGIVTITLKDFDSEHNTLEDFGGSMVFTVTARSDLPETVTITDNVGSDIVLTSGDGPEIENTNKWAKQTYAESGDIVDYIIRVNTDENNVTNFLGVDTPSPGLKYVEDSFYVTDSSSNRVDDGLFEIEDKGDTLEFTNTRPFNEKYYLHYQMLVTTTEEKYHNNFTATYDTIVDSSQNTIDYDIDGSGFVDFSNGKIQVKKVDSSGKPLAGAEFAVYNSDGHLVDNLVTGDDGLATSLDLALGDYQVIETKAPDGYVLDSTPHNITVDTDGEISVVTAVNERYQTPDITSPEYSRLGNIQITKVDDFGNVLSGAEFDIVNSSNTVVDHVVTDENGLAKSIDLDLGDYQIIETKAPGGYQLDSTPHAVTIASNGETVEITITNYPDNPDENKETTEVESDETMLVPTSEKADDTPISALAVTGGQTLILLVSAVILLVVFILCKIYIAKSK